MNRRDFAKWITTTILAGTSCKRPEITIENKVKPSHSPNFENIFSYKTCFPYFPFPLPIIIETYEGIPFRIKNNFNSDDIKINIPPFAFASNYILFDKHRLKKPTIERKETNLPEALNILLNKIKIAKEKDEKIAIIATRQNSIYFDKLCDEIENAAPFFEIIQLPIFDYYKSNLEANKEIFNDDIFLQPNIAGKKVIFNFGQDFLHNDPFNPLLILQFDKRNQILITFENIISLTGLNSTFRFTFSESDILRIALDFLAIIFESKFNLNPTNYLNNLFLENLSNKLPEEVLNLIKFYKNDIVFLCNPYSPPQLHMITTLLNYLCNEDLSKDLNFKYWISDLHWYTRSYEKLKSLLINSSDYCLIIFLDYNPYFSLNKELIEFVEKTDTTKLVNLSLYNNELSDKASIFIPLQTYFEFWADREFPDGTIFFQQKIIEPINKNSISNLNFLFILRNELLKKNINGKYFNELNELYLSFDSKFNLKDAINNGFKIRERTPKKLSIAKVQIELPKLIEQLKLTNNLTPETSKILIFPSQSSYSGEYSKNVYLFENPEPIFGNRWSAVYPITNSTNDENFKFNSDFLVYQNTDYLKRFFSISLPNIFAKEVEFSHKYSINRNQLMQLNQGFTTTKQNPFISDMKLFSPLKEVEQNIDRQLYQNTYINKDKQWAMVIDLDKCIGCNHCILACQIENNIPVVGREYAQKIRTMNWLEIIKVRLNNSKLLFLPILCQHCDNAPCESVCPVGATSHSADGINEMTYNQCIGSRICMANCPYKVRKFNFENPEKMHLNYIPEMMNPFVTIRSRGVTEKCTFCIQRVNLENTKAKLFGNEDNFVVKTACQEACPVNAIKFGRKKSLLVNENQDDLFVLLPEFNTLPNVFYKMSKNEQKIF